MIESLWQEHFSTVFPAGYAGKEIKGIDLTLLDADTAGCISTYLTNGGNLDLWRTAILGLCYRDLTLLIAELDGEAYNYFLRLETLAGLTLKAIIDKTKEK